MENKRVAWELPKIEFSGEFTTNFCPRCKPHGKCLGLKTLSDKAWKESNYFHTAVVDQMIEEIPQEMVSTTKPVFSWK